MGIGVLKLRGCNGEDAGLQSGPALTPLIYQVLMDESHALFRAQRPHL